MDTAMGPRVSERLPVEAWDLLKEHSKAVFVDVRTKAEWSFVGKPDLSDLGHTVLTIEWSRFPDMSVNPQFVENVQESFGDSTPPIVFFLCRSGVRSLHAAKAMRDAMTESSSSIELVNVIGGFEGDLNEEQHRGGLNGWKASGLPWRQS